jgi:hypothetical protein
MHPPSRAILPGRHRSSHVQFWHLRPTPFAVEQGADDIDDLQTQRNAAAMASHLGLPPLKHNRLVDALVPAD